jgi:hypothetical protein
MKSIKKIGLFLLFVLGANALKAQEIAQTEIGTVANTKLLLYEYYNHTGPEWIKLFRMKNYNADLGFWGRSGVSGRVYFVDYQGEGGAFVDFSFPQYISAQQKPVITLSGASVKDIEWYAFPGSDGPGRDYYDVYIKTPGFHVGLSFLVRGSDYVPVFTKADQPTATANWSYSLSPESFNFYSGTGKLGLGTLNPTERLSVNGNIRAKELKIEAANWPDYVFERDYQLPTLEQTEKHIQEKGHLPGIPSAAEVKAEGIEVGEMNAKLLKKIEELTLYLIELKKEVKELKVGSKNRFQKIKETNL